MPQFSCCIELLSYERSEQGRRRLERCSYPARHGYAQIKQYHGEFVCVFLGWEAVFFFVVVCTHAPEMALGAGIEQPGPHVPTISWRH